MFWKSESSPNYRKWARIGVASGLGYGALALAAPYVEDYAIFPRNEGMVIVLNPQDPEGLESQLGVLAARMCPNTDEEAFVSWVYDNNRIPSDPKPNQVVRVITPVCD